jgi:hypothetical protein
VFVKLVEHTAHGSAHRYDLAPGADRVLLQVSAISLFGVEFAPADG